MNGKSISVDGIETYYVEQGEGPTIVFMHGGSPGMDAWACWMRQFAGLARNYRVIAFDQIGYGRSGGPLLPRVERTDHAVGFLKKLGIRDACLVGHSEGGFLITRAAILAPETAGRLVLVAPGSSAPMLGGNADPGTFFSSGRGCGMRKDAYTGGVSRHHRSWLDSVEGAVRTRRTALSRSAGQLSSAAAQARPGPRRCRQGQAVDTFMIVSRASCARAA